MVGKLYFLLLFTGECKSFSLDLSRARNNHKNDAFSRGLKVNRLENNVRFNGLFLCYSQELRKGFQICESRERRMFGLCTSRELFFFLSLAGQIHAKTCKIIEPSASG